MLRTTIVNPTPPPPPPTPPRTPPDRPRPPPAALLHQAFVRVLRPMVRVAIQAGVTYPVFADLLRGLYVDVASRDLLPDERSRTDSRISVLTGVHRKELRRQRLVDRTPEPATLTLTSQVIGRWLGTPALTDAKGWPKPLPRLGPAPSFEALVGAVTRDVRPRALLDTLIDKGVVVLDPDDTVRMQDLAFIPQADRETQVYYFARNLHDHMAAAAANVITAETPPFMERAVHYDGLSAAAAAAVAEAARAAALATLLDVNRRALAVADADDAAASPEAPRRHRVNFGVYVYSEEAPDVAG